MPEKRSAGAMEFVLEFQQEPFSTWLREGDLLPSVPVYYALLAFHAVGMAVLAGTWWVLSLRLLGYFDSLSMAVTDQAMKLCWFGFLISLGTGLALFLAQPIQELMNPAFDVKTVLIAGALLGMATVRQWLDQTAIMASARPLGIRVLPVKARAAVLLTDLLWFAVIIAGRLIGYLQGPPIT